MSSQSEDKKLLVVQSNNGMYSVIHEMVFCDDVAWLKANQIPITGPGKPNLILQDCQVVSGNYLLICSDMPPLPFMVLCTNGIRRFCFLQDCLLWKDKNLIISRI